MTAGAASGAEGAEVRKPRIHAGWRAVGRCGRSAEEVRKHTAPVVPALPAGPLSCPPAPELAAAGRPAGLVRARAPENPREGGPAQAPYGAELRAPQGLVAGEREPAAGEDQAGGRVLTHPAFDRPPVPNERRPGRKAGAVSLAAARRRKAAEAQCPQAAPPGAPVRLVHQGAGLRDRDARGLAESDCAVIDAALSILGRRLRTPGALFDSPAATRDYVRLHLAGWDRERFAVLFLDGQHRLIELEVMFEGTLTQTSVYPREVVRRALHWNAAAVILAHNHPSGLAEPSTADQHLTRALRAALAVVDVRVLDHLVIGWPDVVSLAERGMM